MWLPQQWEARLCSLTTFTGTALTWFQQGPAKRKPPFHKIRSCIRESQAIPGIRPGRERWSEFLPISSRLPLSAVLPATPSLAVAPSCFPSTTEHFQQHTAHRAAALPLQPVALSCWAVLPPCTYLRTGLWSHLSQSSAIQPSVRGASLFAKAADVRVKNLGHIQHITVSNHFHL